MASAKRRAKESPIGQGKNERLAYTVPTTLWGGGGTSPIVKVYDVTDGETDVTSSSTTGSATIAGDTITTPLIHTLTAGHRYRVDVQWTKGSETYEAYFELLGER